VRDTKWFCYNCRHSKWQNQNTGALAPSDHTLTLYLALIRSAHTHWMAGSCLLPLIASQCSWTLPVLQDSSPNSVLHMIPALSALWCPWEFT
jgi:hypothetical protein